MPLRAHKSSGLSDHNTHSRRRVTLLGGLVRHHLVHEGPIERLPVRWKQGDFHEPERAEENASQKHTGQEPEVFHVVDFSPVMGWLRADRLRNLGRQIMGIEGMSKGTGLIGQGYASTALPLLPHRLGDLFFNTYLTEGHKR